MKQTKKLLSAALVFLMLLSVSAISAFAETKDLTFSLRIEGSKNTYFYSDVTLEGTEETENVSVAQLLTYVNNTYDDVDIIGADRGYIYAVNGEFMSQFSGWDGWYYAVNGIAPNVGIGDYNLSDGDSVVLYYGDYPCYIPEIDTTWFAANGTIKFTSTESTYNYDPDTDTWIETVVKVPVTDMTVTLDDTLTYVTDENGEIKVNLNTVKFTSSQIKLQVEKYNEAGAPTVLRYASDFTINPPERTCELYGDPDNDGNISVKDATLIQMYLVGFEELDVDSYISADFNEDYDVSVADATAIQIYLAFGTK